MTLQILKSIARICNSSDGKNLLEYLEDLSKTTIKELKYCDPALRECNVGRAQMVDEIIDFISKAEYKTIEQTRDNPADWSL